jgi:hypothetical protein
MSKRNQASDVRGASRMVVDATAGLTDLVEALHRHIARPATRAGGPVIGGTVAGVTELVYDTIRGVTRVVGAGVDRVLAELAPLVGELDPAPRREALVAALNGVLGDYLVETGNPLAVPMRLRRDGQPLALTRADLAAVARPGARLLVLAHGLCMNDLQWLHDGHDHGAALERDLGYARVCLHYNTGRHISTNGRDFAALLEELVTQWPQPLDDLTIVAHSMGGLVTRSAFHYGTLAAHEWTGKLRRVVFVGTPHHGAPWERGGQWLHLLLGVSGYTEPFARLARVRSAGITDLRYGSLLDEDWQGRDRFARGKRSPRPLPLPPGVECFAIAGTMSPPAGVLAQHLLGDGVVPVRSALGQHDDPERALPFPPDHTWIAPETGHLALLGRPEVYERIREWLAA